MARSRDQTLISLKEGATASERRRAMAAVRRSRRGRRGPQRCFRELGVIVAPVGREQLAELRAHPDIDRASLVDKPLEAIVPDEADSQPVASRELDGAAGPLSTWGLERLEVDALWKRGLDGAGVVVGHLDSGVDEEHPALSGALAHRAYVDARGRAGSRARLGDTEKHGTHTAGTICGRPTDAFRVGVAPGARLASAVVIHGGNPLLRVLGGLAWLLRLEDARIRVVSLSLGFPGSVPQFRLTMQRLREFGILPVAAIGNDGPRRSRAPGNVPETLGVGAMDEEGAMWARSCSQRFDRRDDPITPDLVAPGVRVQSAALGRGYRLDTGTSMAVPHVAGLAALLFGARPQATVDQVEQAILESCRPLEGVDAARQGRGVPHAPTALARLEALT